MTIGAELEAQILRYYQNKDRSTGPISITCRLVAHADR
jgi:hypothetical protein